MSEHDALLAAICEHPEDDVVRLVYADWLEENGADARAELIRLQIELAGLLEDDPRRPELRRRQADLLARYGDAWRAALPRLEGITWGDFERGFVTAVTAEDEPTFDRCAPALFAAAPVRRLHLRRVGTGDVWEFSTGPRNFRQDFTGVERLATSPHLARLADLDLAGAVIGAGGVRALTASPHLSGLTALHLANNGIEPAAAEVLAHSPLLARLRALDLGCNLVESDGARALAHSAHVAGLTELDLSRNNIGSAGALALVRSPYLGGLTRLVMQGNGAVSAYADRRLRQRFGQDAGSVILTLGELARVTEIVDALAERGLVLGGVLPQVLPRPPEKGPGLRRSGEPGQVNPSLPGGDLE
jgi:uncharacterized protein (TIGR02996 family)